MATTNVVVAVVDDIEIVPIVPIVLVYYMPHIKVVDAAVVAV